MLTQFKKGIVELCVLKVVSQKDMYGFEVMESLTNQLDVNENTIYPLLRRLTTQELLKTYEKSSSSGANRKYYQITTKGEKFLKENLEEWFLFLNNVTEILGGREKCNKTILKV